MRVRDRTYEVERIVSGPRSVDGAYLVKWAGFPDAENTWEPRINLPYSVFDEEGDSLSSTFEVISPQIQSLTLNFLDLRWVVFLTLSSYLTLTLKVIH